MTAHHLRMCSEPHAFDHSDVLQRSTRGQLLGPPLPLQVTVISTYKGRVFIAVCLSDCQQDDSRTAELISMTFGGEVGRLQRKNPFKFGAD